MLVFDAKELSCIDVAFQARLYILAFKRRSPRVVSLCST